MSTSIDNRVVELKFNNSQFQSEAQNSLSMLDKLKAALKMDGAAKGLSEVDKAAKSVNLKGISQGADEARGKFDILKTVAVGALAAIAAKAVGLPSILSKILPINDIMSGFGEYETKMGSIQTILANTARHGTTTEDVTKALDELNSYADKTIYSFSEMTKNAGLFTNAGIKIEDATGMIRGFSNAAAMAGVGAADAARAAFQMSQALSTGQIRAVDWMSMKTAGVANLTMKESLIQVAQAMGTLKKGSKSADATLKDFEGTLKDGWLTTDVFSTYLNILAQDNEELNRATMKSIGLNDQQIDSFIKQQKIAEDSATKVRTFTQLMGTLAEAQGSGWARSVELVIGDFDKATEMFTYFSDKLGAQIGASADARNAILEAWGDDPGGRAAVVEGIKAALDGLLDVLGVIKSAWSEVFPSSGATKLIAISTAFRDFMLAIKPTPETLERLKSVLIVVFTVLKATVGVAIQTITANFRILMSVLGVVGELFAYAFDQINNAWKEFTAGFGSGGGKPLGVLEALAGAVDFLVGKFLEFRETGVDSIVGWIDGLKKAIQGWKDWGSSADMATKKASIFAKAGEFLKGVWDGVKVAVSDVGAFVSKANSVIGGFFKDVGKAIGDFFKSLDFSGGGPKIDFDLAGPIGRAIDGMAQAFAKVDIERALSFLNSGILLMVMKNLADIFKSAATLKEGIEAFAGIGESLNDTLGTMQKSMKVSMVKNIAISIAILAGAFWILAQVPADKLDEAVAGMSVAIVALAGTLMVLEKITVNPGKMIMVGVALTAMAGAITIFAAAVLIFGNMEWEQLAKGLVGFTVSIGIMVAAALILDKVKGSLIAASIGLQFFAVALSMMAGAVMLFGMIPIEALQQGLTAVGLIALGLVVFVNAMRGAPLLETGAGIMMIALAISTLLIPITALGLLPLDILTQGMIAVGLALIGLAVAARLAQGSMAGAASITAMAIAVNLLVGPLITLGLLPFGVLMQGIGGIAVSLGLLALTANLMVGALPGAAAIVAISASLLILSVAIIMLGSTSLETIGIGLLGMVVALGAFAAAALLLMPAIPAMTGMASAVLIFGAAVLVIGIGIVLFSAGLIMLGAAAAVGGAGIQILAMAIVQVVPHAAGILAVGAAFVVLGAGLVLAGVGILVVAAGLLLLSAGLIGLGLAAPIGVTGIEILIEGMKKVAAEAIAMGIAVLALTGLGVASAAAAIGVTALGVGLLALGLGLIGFSDAARFAGKGADSLGKALGSLGDNAGKASNVAGIMTNIAGAASGMGGSLNAAASSMANVSVAILRVGQSSMVAAQQVTILPRAATTSFVAVATSANSLSSSIVKMAAEVTSGMTKVNSTMSQSASQMTSSMNLMATSTQSGTGRVTAAINLMNQQVNSTLRGMVGSVGNSAVLVGQAIINGMVRGMSNSSAVTNAARAVAQRALAAAKNTLGIASPSKEFEKIGEYVNEGFAKGLRGSEDEIDRAFDGMLDKVKEAMTKADEEIAKHREVIDRISKKSARRRTASEKQQLADAKKALAAAEELRWRSYQAHDMVLGMMKNEEVQLKRLRNEYDQVTDELKEARTELDNAIKTRDDAAKSWGDKYGKLDDMTFDADKGENLQTYMDNLQKQYEATLKYRKDLEQLRKLGIADEIYKDLVDKGLDGQEFVSQLLDGGWGAVKNINNLNSALDNEASKLGTAASRELYQAGVDAARGLVEGLESRQHELASQMERMADKLVNALKWKLGIKSPSKVFAKLGVHTTEGLVKGLRKSMTMVDKPMEDVGDHALEALRQSLRGVSDILNDEISSDPVIRPVIDLTDIQKNSGRIAGMLPNWNIDTAGIRARAYGVRAAVEANTGEAAEVIPGDASTTLNYTQNNFSPKALSNAEIYRQTRNQLSKIKEGLPS